MSAPSAASLAEPEPERINTPTIIASSPVRQKLNQPFTGYRLTAATRAALDAMKVSPPAAQAGEGV